MEDKVGGYFSFLLLHFLLYLPSRLLTFRMWSAGNHALGVDLRRSLFSQDSSYSPRRTKTRKGIDNKSYLQDRRSSNNVRITKVGTVDA